MPRVFLGRLSAAGDEHRVHVRVDRQRVSQRESAR
jgi:hypothetical protein